MDGGIPECDGLVRAQPEGGCGADACASGRLRSMELMVARNPDLGSSLPYLLWVPIDGGLVFRTKGTWPRTNALYCHPVDRGEWPAQPEIVERVRLRACDAAGCCGRRDLRSRARAALADRVHTRARARHGVLAVAAHAQAVTPRGAAPQRSRAGRRRACDPRRRSRALPLHVQGSAGARTSAER